MIQKLYEDHFLEIDALLTKESKRLKLSPNEVVVLKTLFQNYKRRTFSILSISRKIELSSNDIGKAVDKLINKGFLNLNLETRNEKEVEVFDLTGTFKKITELYESDLEQIKQEKNESKISTTIEMLEQHLGKALSSMELEIIRSWYDESLYTHESIISKIEELGPSGRFSIKFLERNLNREKLKSNPIDEKADQVIDAIFKAI
ncbi:DnaD domain protein [Acholeplasma granularum]|uniref:DnaD domain protein n=1 Tax=Acholeplasma granularum TaxID=264635 RepID=UPI0004700D31|nr:DnaD domain protein [Acholeplasma granularum]